MRLIAAVTLLVVLSAVLALPAAAGERPAPNFSLKTAEGKTVELKQLAGKGVVVNFWATWCPPCRAEIPGMLKVYERLKGKGLEIVGIALDRNGWTAVTPFVEKSRITYPVVLDNGDVARKFGEIQYIPTTYFIDRKGNIVSEHTGGMSEEDFEKAVKKIL